MEKSEKKDAFGGILQLLDPQQQNLKFNELAALLGLLDLWAILNLLQGNVPLATRTDASNIVQEALSAVLGQSGGGSVKPTPDLMGVLTKNPALLTGLMNLLMGAKEPKVIKDKNEGGELPSERENSNPQSIRSNRIRGN
ncbi:hypothetical protein MHOCP_01930 [Moorella humiferrea]|uniref:hypothetical protein n=1 Tax=Neomoorella humiferrea TaxID=676965 RepID=UPI0030CAB8B8